MAACPACQKPIAVSEDQCPHCGEMLRVVSDPDPAQIEALKEDIERYVEEVSPEDAELAERQIESWRPTPVPLSVEPTTAEEAVPVPIYSAPDEVAARLVTSLLQSAGIEAVATRHTVPGLDTAQSMEEGIWGQVLVHARDVAQARELLTDYESPSASDIAPA